MTSIFSKERGLRTQTPPDALKTQRAPGKVQVHLFVLNLRLLGSTLTLTSGTSPALRAPRGGWNPGDLAVVAEAVEACLLSPWKPPQARSRGGLSRASQPRGRPALNSRLPSARGASGSPPDPWSAPRSAHAPSTRKQ